MRFLCVDHAQRVKEVLLAVAIANLAITATMTLGACVLLGWRIGLFIGVVPFLILGGFSAIGEILMYWVRRKFGDQLDEQGTNPFLTDSEDDPSSLVTHTDMSGYEHTDCHGGLVVTGDGALFEYEVTLTDDGARVEESECHRVDEKYAVAEHLPGKGKSYGWLCMEVLQELNGLDS